MEMGSGNKSGLMRMDGISMREAFRRVMGMDRDQLIAQFGREPTQRFFGLFDFSSKGPVGKWLFDHLAKAREGGWLTPAGAPRPDRPTASAERCREEGETGDGAGGRSRGAAEGGGV